MKSVKHNYEDKHLQQLEDEYCQSKIECAVNKCHMQSHAGNAIIFDQVGLGTFIPRFCDEHFKELLWITGKVSNINNYGYSNDKCGWYEENIKSKETPEFIEWWNNNHDPREKFGDGAQQSVLYYAHKADALEGWIAAKQI